MNNNKVEMKTVNGPRQVYCGQPGVVVFSSPDCMEWTYLDCQRSARKIQRILKRLIEETEV